VREPGSDDFNALIEGRDDVLVSDLAVTEFVSALSRRLRQGTVTRDIARQVYRAILERLGTGAAHQRLELTRDVHRRAEHLLLSVTGVPLRAADALHLALAVSAGARSLASFDARLVAAARSVGLATYPA
jgi:hypothetical protein